jgi:hypothetical protein
MVLTPVAIATPSRRWPSRRGQDSMERKVFSRLFWILSILSSSVLLRANALINEV